MNDLTGTVIEDRYQFGVCLGEGTFAKVYQVHDAHRNVDLAAKVLRTDISNYAQLLERFRRESDMLARLQHPHIVRFYDLIETDDVAFILMDFVPGKTLQAALYNLGRPFGVNEVFTHLKPLAAGLHYAHGEGIVHRDLKPANILLHENGNLLITDFGLARPLDDNENPKKASTSGTPLYMSPEQILNYDTSRATDVYALGVILYQMLAGAVPFNGSHPVAEGSNRAERIMYEHLHVKPAPIRDFQEQVPQAVEEVVMRCLVKEPIQRPGGVREVYDAMAEAIGAAPSELTPLPESQAKLPPVSQTLPELSQFIRFSTQESSQPWEQDATATSRQVAVEEETAENIYPRQVLEGRERPTIQNSRPIYIQQHLPPDQVSISKPTPPGIVVPPTPRLPTAETYVQSKGPSTHYTLFLVIGVVLVLASCGGLALYMLGAFDTGDSDEGQALVADDIPTVTSQSETGAATSLTNVPSSTVGSVPTQPTAMENSAVLDDVTSGLIVYASDRYESLDIYITDPDASQIRQVIAQDTTMNETGPAWSPDGNFIAYYAYAVNDSDADIYVMNADGTNPRNLTDSPDEDDRYVTWSPDGQRLAFHSNRRSDDPNDDTRDFEIVIYDLTTDELTPLTANEVRDLGPDWSSDGRYLAFHSSDPETGRSRITVYDFVTGTQETITPPSLEARFPTWSPDGSQLAFHVEEDDSFTQLYVVDANGENLRLLLQLAVNDFFPDWSPTGEEIVFHRRTTEGTFGIFRYQFESGEVIAVGDQLRDFFPDWHAPTP